MAGALQGQIGFLSRLLKLHDVERGDCPEHVGAQGFYGVAHTQHAQLLLGRGFEDKIPETLFDPVVVLRFLEGGDSVGSGEDLPK